MLEKIKVENSDQEQAFIHFPTFIHQHNSEWIRPLDQDIKSVFDPQKNKFFIDGVCERFLFYKEGTQVAQVAVFTHPKLSHEIPTGGLGFFDAINDQEVATEVFDFCKDWLQQRGIEAMDGPINFGERDKWWGLLVEGFHEPLYCMNYHPPYYQQLFEDYGFQNYFNQECYGLKISEEYIAHFKAAHNKLSQDKDLSIKKITKKDLGKFASDFRIIYNKSFATHGDGKHLDERQVQKMFKAMKAVLDEHICYIVYHKEEPIACWINLPDLNQYFKHFNGQLGWWQKLQFVYRKMFYPANRIVGIVFGIVPEWHGKGIDGFMIVEGCNNVIKYNHYQNYELQWIGDFNPKMIKIAHHLKSELTRRLTTYRYIFDRTKPFNRHKTIGV